MKISKLLGTNEKQIQKSFSELLACTIYGSVSGYWCNGVDYGNKEDAIKTMGSLYVDDKYISNYIKYSKAENPFLIVHTDSGKKKLTYKKMEKDLELMLEGYTKCLKRIIAEEYDAVDADVFFQMAVFGKVVYE